MVILLLLTNYVNGLMDFVNIQVYFHHNVCS